MSPCSTLGSPSLTGPIGWRLTLQRAVTSDSSVSSGSSFLLLRNPQAGLQPRSVSQQLAGLGGVVTVPTMLGGVLYLCDLSHTL